MIESFQTELSRYRAIGEKALAQVPDDALARAPVPDANSVASLVRHLSGNLKSRFTDFLTTDGEKPWRERDREFDGWQPTRGELEAAWSEGWEVLERAVGDLSDSHLQRQVTIRGQNLTVHAAGEWEWISIPKGGSAAYNADPTMEKGYRKP